MLALLGWFFLCFLLAALSAPRPIYLLVGAMVLRLAVPSYASNSYLVGLHLAGYLVVATACIQLVFYWPRVRNLLLKSKFELTCFALCLALMLANALSANSRLLDILMNIAIVYLTPFLFYLLLKMEIHRLGMRALQPLVLALHATMLYELWLALQQRETGQVLVFAQQAQQALWFQGDENAGRSYGTFEGGLELSTVCIFAIGMTYWVRNSYLQVALILAYLNVNLLGSGRAALVLGLGLGLLILLTSKASLLAKTLSSLLGLGGLIFLYFSEAGETMLQKINDDGGSNQKRLDALHWVGRNFEYFILSGYPGARDLRTAGELSSSLENAYLMVGMDYGLIFTAALLTLQLGIILKNIRSLAGLTMGLTALGIILVNMTNSGFSSNSVSAYLIWIALGLCSVGSWVSPAGYLQAPARKSPKPATPKPALALEQNQAQVRALKTSV